MSSVTPCVSSCVSAVGLEVGLSEPGVGLEVSGLAFGALEGASVDRVGEFEIDVVLGDGVLGDKVILTSRGLAVGRGVGRDVGT